MTAHVRLLPDSRDTYFTGDVLVYHRLPGNIDIPIELVLGLRALRTNSVAFFCLDIHGRVR